jgi:hypothetical protein
MGADTDQQDLADRLMAFANTEWAEVRADLDQETDPDVLRASLLYVGDFALKAAALVTRMAKTITDLRTDGAAAERAGNEQLSIVRARVEFVETAVRDRIKPALGTGPGTCPFHGTDFGFLGWQDGQPRCDSCKRPYRLAEAAAAIQAVLHG